MQDAPKAVWSIPYVVSVAFFASLKLNLIAYRSSKVSSRPDCIFEIQQLWQSGFSKVYSNFCCSCWFEPEIIKISQSSHKMYSNNIVNFQESTRILNACTKQSGNLLKAPRTRVSLKKCLVNLATLFKYQYNYEGNISFCKIIKIKQWLISSVLRSVTTKEAWVVWNPRARLSKDSIKYDLLLL